MRNTIGTPGKEGCLRDPVACNEDLKTFFKITQKEIGEEGDIVLASLLGTRPQLAHLGKSPSQSPIWCKEKVSSLIIFMPTISALPAAVASNRRPPWSCQ